MLSGIRACCLDLVFISALLSDIYFDIPKAALHHCFSTSYFYCLPLPTSWREFLPAFFLLLSFSSSLHLLIAVSSLSSVIRFSITSKLMEALLAHSFDYLSSYEPNKVRKGLRQVEGLLAQICLSKAKQSPVAKRRSYLGGSSQPGPKALTELKDDPAFREFFKLQEGFQWNGTDLMHMRFVFSFAFIANGVL